MAPRREEVDMSGMNACAEQAGPTTGRGQHGGHRAGAWAPPAHP